MLYWCYLYIGGVKHKSDIVVDVKEEEGRMLLQFSTVDLSLIHILSNNVIHSIQQADSSCL